MKDFWEGLGFAVVLVAALFVIRGCLAGCDEHKSGNVECKTSGASTICYSRTYNTWLMKYEIEWHKPPAEVKP